MNQLARYRYCPSALLVAGCLAMGTAGASSVTLRLDTDVPGDASNSINITGDQFEEVALPIYHDFQSGTEQGIAGADSVLRLEVRP